MVRRRYNFIQVFKKAKSLEIATCIASFLTVAALTLSFIVLSLYPSQKSLEDTTTAFSAIQKEQELLLISGNTLAGKPMLSQAILDMDSYQILALTKDEVEKSGIGSISIADAQGFIVSRTKTSTKRGDNIFLATPWGRFIKQELTPFSSVESSTINGETRVALVSGRPIRKENEIVGALFANQITDSAYAQSFVKKYMDEGSHVAFYSEEGGIYGHSFLEPEIDTILSSLGIAGTGILESNFDGKVFTLKGKTYIAQAQSLSGLEKSTTGFIVFTPLNSMHIAIVVMCALPIVFLIVTAFVLHCRIKKEKNLKGFYKTFIILVCINIAVTALLLVAEYRRIHPLSTEEYPLYNSTLSLNPESGIFLDDSTQKISIILSSGGEAINTIQTTLRFDPESTSVESIDMNESICTDIIDQYIDTENGLITLSCIILGKPFEENIGIVADIYIRGNGFSSLVFTDDTQVLAHDGLGTDVLRTTHGGSYSFVEGDVSSALNLFSPTHPNQTRWYNSPVIDLVWEKEKEVDIKVYNSEGMQIIEDSIFGNTWKSNALPDGRYVASVARKDGTMSMYAINIDSAGPHNVEIKTSDSTIAEGDFLRLEAHAEDAGSGLQKAFFIKVDNNLFYPSGKNIYIPFLEKGDHSITLRAFDNANNYTDSTITISVE